MSTRSDPTALFPELSLQLDPIQTMREMLRWDPFTDLYRGMPPERSAQLFNPLFDVRETNDAFILEADVPGVQEKDLDISLTSNRLTVTGRREHEEETHGETHCRMERSGGSFSRSFTLPTEIDADRVSAELMNGLLQIQLPKTGESMTRRIPVRGERQVDQPAE
ncbi:MAG: Hsp20/alpha crystallin family protein [Archangium sp.]|nr:Hsp20/alpha crystallin family protein [Archangium sp.]MDP3154452.1 Hsp20/alpha crystallin family protein [Archangium sp.]MDP3572943.1 Hsp20/alpha crystallin family protein [Archangium sp.]